MTRKKDFDFDFNEEADPVDELHRLRVATAKHFKNMKAYAAYLRETPTVADCLAELDAEIAQRKAGGRKRPASNRRQAVKT